MTVDALTIGASNVDIFAGVGGGSADAIGFEITGGQFALALLTDQADPARTWTALKAEVGSAGLVGFDFLTLNATGITVEMNRASVLGGPVVDFAASATPFAVAVGPAAEITLDFAGSRGALTGVSVGRATLAISDYVYASGSFYFEQGSGQTVDVVTGVPATGASTQALRNRLDGIEGLSDDYSRIEDLAVDTLLLSATDVDLFVGLGPYFIDTDGDGQFDAGESLNADRVGLTLDDIDIDFGLAMLRSTAAADPGRVIPNFTAFKLDWAGGVDFDWDFLAFASGDVSVYGNLGGAWTGVTGVAKPYVDFGDDPLEIPTAGGGAPIVIDFDRQVVGFSLAAASLDIADFFHVSGSFAFEKSAGIALDVNTGLSSTNLAHAGLISQLRPTGYLSADGSRLEGLPMDVVTIGAAGVNIRIGEADDPLFEIDDIDLGLALFRASPSLGAAASAIPRMYAMKGHWATPLDVDWGFMQLKVEDLDVGLNRGGQWQGLTVAPTLDFGESGFAVSTGASTASDPDAVTEVLLDFRRATIGVSVGHALIRIDDFIHIEGGFAVEKIDAVALDIRTGFGATPSVASTAALAGVAGVNPLDHSVINDYRMNAVTIGLSDVDLFIGSGPYFIEGSDQRDEDAVGLVIENLDLGLALFNDPAAKVPRLWALSASTDLVGFVGLDFLTLQGSGVEVHANQGRAWGAAATVNPYIDFVSSFGADGMAIATGGDAVSLAFASRVIGASVAQATIQIDQFVYVSGSFAFEKGARHRVSVDTGLTAAQAALLAPQLLPYGATVENAGATIANLEVEAFTIGMTGVDVFVGYGVPDFDSATPIEHQPELFGLALENVDLGLAVLTPTAKALNLPKFTALSATAGTFAVLGGGDIFQLQGHDIAVNVNWSSGWKNIPNAGRPSIDFVESFGAGGLAIATGGDAIALTFEEGVIEASVSNAVLAVSQFVYVSGNFAFRRGASTELTLNGPLNTQLSGVRTESIEFGGSDLSAFVGVGGPYLLADGADADTDPDINPNAVGLVIDDFDFGMAIFRVLPGQGLPADAKFTALKAHGDEVAFVGFGDVIEFSLQDISVGINDSSVTGFSVDFTEGGASTGYEIATGGDPVRLDFDNSVVEASVGHATARISGIVALEGGFAFQRRYLEQVHYNIFGFETGTNGIPAMAGEALVVVAQDVYGFAGINGPYRTDSNGDGTIDELDAVNEGAVGLAIDNLDFALAMVTPAVAPGVELGGIRFFTLEATADFAGLVGTDPFLTLEARNVVLELNGGIVADYPVPIFVDWSENPLTIPIGTEGASYTFDQDSAMLRIGLEGKLGLFDLFTLDIPAFDFTFEMPELDLDIPDLLPRLDLPGLPSLPELDLPEFDLSSFLPRLSLDMLGDLPDIDVDFPGLDFMKGALDFIRNLDLSIGLDANFNLTLFGSLELPDLTLELGDFVYLNGDFKLKFGETFTGTMYTGLPAELELVENLLGSGNQILDAVKSVVGVSGDYSRIDNVLFKGFTFGAADVNVFVGTGGPDFSRPLIEQDDLVGFGMENLDLALTVFQAQGDLAEAIKRREVLLAQGARRQPVDLRLRRRAQAARRGHHHRPQFRRQGRRRPDAGHRRFRRQLPGRRAGRPGGLEGRDRRHAGLPGFHRQPDHRHRHRPGRDPGVGVPAPARLARLPQGRAVRRAGQPGRARPADRQPGHRRRGHPQPAAAAGGSAHPGRRQPDRLRRRRRPLPLRRRRQRRRPARPDQRRRHGPGGR